ncbi:DUF3048 domain-containing protein [Saccharothrix variisporea]|uniref:DUF3048 family protein n=1 Tax=Saccharothrix variisporea TaxID=543527 RepID=A0A495X0X8_9PSEU|nr:DUF3048 domain-containing protein [Saccharothrix variisporea]RKT67570.1 DUF3048 family protein [Saccharothrix variisporea]
MRKWTVAAVVVAVVAAGIAAVVVFRPEDDAPTTTSAAPSATSRPVHPGVYVVKVDNAPAARPQTGLASADVVYVEPVEGGLTRFAAVYSTPPEVVGPVRSARETDLDLLARYGSPVLAYSGSAPALKSLLERSGLVRAPADDTPAAYFRDDNRAAPHNLYVRPNALPTPAAGPEQTTPTGPAPAQGRPETTWQVTYPGTRFDLAWRDGWAISADGTPLRTTEKGEITTTNVVIQHVETRAGVAIEDASGSPSPVVVTVGSGAAEVLRDGQAFEDVTWSRPTPADQTRFTAGGADLPLAPGPTWVFLVTS